MFCEFCKNNSRNLQFGIICSLTNKVAEFENNCSEYIEKPDLIEKKRKLIEQEIDERYFISENLLKLSEKFNINLNFLNTIFTKSYHFKTFKDTQNLNILESLYFHIQMLLLSGFFTMFSIYAYSKSEIKIDSIYIGFISFFGLLFNYIFKSKKKKILLKTNSEGIYYKEQKINWDEILLCKIIKGENRYEQKNILIGTRKRGLFKIDTTNLDISPIDLKIMIELNIKT